MGKKAYYYLPVIYHNGNVTKNKFTDLVDKVTLLDTNDRLKQIGDDSYKLAQFKGYDERTDQADRHFCIGRYRSKKPKTGSKETDDLSDIKGDIIEPVSYYYNYAGNLLMFEYNHYGVRIETTQKYFNFFLPEDTQNDRWELKMIQVDKEFEIEEIYNSNSINSIDIKFNTNSRLENFLHEYNDENNTSLFLDAISNTNEFMKKSGGNIGEIKISKGKLKSNSLSHEDFVKLISLLLNLIPELFVSFKVKYKPAIGKVQEVDLVDYGKYTSKVIRDEENDGHEYIWDKLEENYKDDHTHLSNKIKEFYDKNKISERLLIN